MEYPDASDRRILAGNTFTRIEIIEPLSSIQKIHQEIW